jgi:hypothetical protein
VGFKFTTLVVIGTDCIGSCKSMRSRPWWLLQESSVTNMASWIRTNTEIQYAIMCKFWVGSNEKKYQTMNVSKYLIFYRSTSTYTNENKGIHDLIKNTVWVQLRRGLPDTPLYDQVCQWLVAGWWFSTGTLDSSTNKTYRHDIAEILLKGWTFKLYSYWSHASNK